jgi:predicted NBD/HSP70 family sugar kinase
VEPAKPSLELLRALTDEHVLRALMRQPRLTRAELAAATGVSKPTAGESVRRLVAAGLVADTGQRTAGGRGRGRVGAYYALADTVGLALAVSIAPEGIIAECLDPYGVVVSRAEQAITRPAQPDAVVRALHATATQAIAQARASDGAMADGQALSAGVAARGPVRLAVVSAADPVDRVTGRMVHLPDSPFLLGDLDPVAVLAPLVAGPVIVDNDVNWAARAEREHRPAGPGAPADFAYLYLGEGLGCAVVSDGEVRRGHAGLAGEIAHLLVAGPNGQATSLIDVFGQLGLRQPNATAIDTPRLLAATVSGSSSRAQPGPGAATSAAPQAAAPGSHAVAPSPGSQATAPGLKSQAPAQAADSASQAAPGSVAQANATLQAVAQAVAGAIAAIVALADPAEIVLGGPWGSHPVLAAAIAEAAASLPRPVPVRVAAAATEPSLSGARADALDRLRAAIISRAQPARPS